MSDGRFTLRRDPRTRLYIAVCAQTGERLCAPQHSPGQAETAAENALARRGRRERPCLRCGRQMTSHHVGHRLCAQCHQYADLHCGGLTEYSVGRR